MVLVSLTLSPKLNTYNTQGNGSGDGNDLYLSSICSIVSYLCIVEFEGVEMAGDGRICWFISVLIAIGWDLGVISLC